MPGTPTVDQNQYMATDNSLQRHEHPEERRRAASLPRVWMWVPCLLILVAAAPFILEHRIHALGLLPYVVLLACPLIHVYMHGRHGGHAHHAEPIADPPRKTGDAE